MKKKLLAALLATAMTVTMFAGCGTPGSKDSKKDDSSASSGKKRITYTLREDLPSMDPQNSNSISCATAEICTYAMLTRNVEGEVKPDAAESWDISDDGLTYTFHLRDGLKWSDGEDVKAGDYVYGIQRLMDPEMASDYAFIGYILKNGAEVNKGSVPVDELGVSAPDDKTVVIDPDSIFDIQIKRLHEYKRQQMNALYIIHKYLEIKAGKKPVRPLTFIFGAKAAPAYIIAQDIIHLLLVLQEIVNNDPDVNRYMTVLMVENYNVTYAEKLIPACDISEQISLASKEASGTGNMKFMLNGAVTLGTSDGANVEINELVGDDNIYIFGAKSEEVIEHYTKADYVSKDYYEKSPVIKEAVDFIVGKQALAAGHKENLERLYKELLNKDWFMTLLDLEAYIKEKDKAFADYEDRTKWKKMMLVKIAKAGFFSSDRTIAEYNRDIWKLK